MNKTFLNLVKNRRKTVLFLTKIGISITILWVVFHYLETEDIRKQITEAEFAWIIPGIVSIIVINLMKAWRFTMLGNAMNLYIPKLRCFLAHLITPILGFVTPGKLGEGVKILYMKESRRELGFVFIVERFLDMITLMVVAACGFVVSDLYPLSFLLLVAVLTAGGVLMLKLEWFMNLITRVLFKKEYFCKNWVAERVKRCMTRHMIAPVMMTLAIWSLGYFAFWSFARSVDINVSYPKIALVFSWAIILGVLSSLPGGVGVREGSITVMLHTLFAVPKSAGAALAVLNLGIHYGVLTGLSLFGLMLYNLLGLSKK